MSKHKFSSHHVGHVHTGREQASSFLARCCPKKTRDPLIQITDTFVNCSFHCVDETGGMAVASLGCDSASVEEETQGEYSRMMNLQLEFTNGTSVPQSAGDR